MNVQGVRTCALFSSKNFLSSGYISRVVVIAKVWLMVPFQATMETNWGKEKLLTETSRN